MLRISDAQKKLGIALSLIVLVLVLGGLAEYFPSASNQNYAPEQPIPFSHKLHAGDNKIACLYCHSAAEKSRHASIPSVNVCMNCHTVVKPDSPWIQKVQQAYAENKPIEWVRIHELPDYVYFPHKRHVAKGVACQACHGPVQDMAKVYQYAPLTMGWCMECHRGQTTPRNVLANVYPNMKDPHGAVAATNCNTCHN
jgi:hypothetical protein